MSKHLKNCLLRKKMKIVWPWFYMMALKFSIDPYFIGSEATTITTITTTTTTE